MSERTPILLVEDDEVTAELETRALARAGHVVRKVRGAQAAMDLMRDEAFSVVLLDYHLEDGLSWPVLEAAQAAVPSLPVVLVTGMGDETVAAEAMQRGAAAYVIKVAGFCDQLVRHVERLTRLGEIERENARLAAIVEASDDAIFSTTVEGIIVTWNRGAEQVFGYTAEEMVGQSAFRLTPPEILAQPDKLLLPATRRGENLRNRQTTALHRDGRQVFLSVSTSPLRHPGSSEVVGMSVIARDISAQVAVESSLRRSEDRCRRLMESNVVGVHIATREGNVLDANDSFLDMLGYRRDDMPFRWVDLIPSDRRAELAGFHEVIDRTGRLPMQELEFLAADGRRVPVLFALTQLEEDQALVMTLDLTSSKRLERELLQAQKMEGIGRLAGGMAHDFNNLLTVINGYCQLLRDRLLPQDPMWAEVGEICDAGERAARLTGQLLAFSRKQVVNPQPIELNSVVSNVSRMLRRLIGEDIDFETRLAPHLPPTRADAGQMEQVLLNLAVNARDAMPVGGKLTIETQQVELSSDYLAVLPDLSPGPYVLLAVSDTGTGMDGATAARVFEPFFTTKEQGKGTGLGLSTVYGIVRQSQGHVNVYSEPGQGTTFKVYLPVCASVPDSPEAAVAHVDTKGCETVLVVEDDPSIGRFLQLLLKQRGYRVLFAANGVQAMDLAQRHRDPIHLLLTDLVMPRMGGRDLAQKLEPVHPETRVIYMSGYADDAVLHHGHLEPGMVFVAKPFAPDALLRRIREVLGSAEVSAGQVQGPRTT